jgi:hypothetical protein
VEDQHRHTEASDRRAQYGEAVRQETSDHEADDEGADRCRAQGSVPRMQRTDHAPRPVGLEEDRRADDHQPREDPDLEEPRVDEVEREREAEGGDAGAPMQQQERDG